MGWLGGQQADTKRRRYEDRERGVNADLEHKSLQHSSCGTLFIRYIWGTRHSQFPTRGQELIEVQG
jgi:hypothetical protein